MNIIFMGTPIFACGILREFDTSKFITITITA